MRISANNLTDMFDFKKPDFARYMYNDGSLNPAKTWGTPVNVQINNALMGVSNLTEGAFINKNGEVMVPLLKTLLVVSMYTVQKMKRLSPY